MKKKKTLFFEIDHSEVEQAVILMVCAKYPEYKEHIKKNGAQLTRSGPGDSDYTLSIDGLIDDE